MQMPEYLPGVPSPDIPGQFKGAFEEDYKKRLRERRRYLAWKREEHVGAAIEGTDAYRERAAMLVRGRGAERELRAEMLAARKSWFGAARGLAPGNEWANTFDPWPSLMTRSAETQRVATEHRPPH